MTFDDIQTIFGEQGFTVEPSAGLPAGNQIRSTTSVKVRHHCGRARAHGITLQRARDKDFEICPDCHPDYEERMYERSSLMLEKELAGQGMKLSGGTGMDIYGRSNNCNPKIKTHAQIEHLSCGYIWEVSVTNILRPGGVGCPQCAANLRLTPEEVTRRAKEYGLHVLNAADYKGNSTRLTYRCDTCERVFSRTWQSQRSRGCGNCTRNFGEILLEALCRHYLPSGTWQSQYPISGLVPDSPDTKLYYDVANPELQVVLENHGEYHFAETFSFNGKNIDHTLETRQYYDRLKRQAVGPGRLLDGWRYVEFRFELTRLRSMVDTSGSYLPAVCKEFREAMTRAGFAQIADAADATIEDIFAYLNPLRVIEMDVKDKGFTVPAQPWLGRGQPYRLIHRCGRTTEAVVTELRAKWDEGLTGCSWCDRTGREGEWRTFVESMQARGWHYRGDPLVRRSEHQDVTFVCRHHPDRGEMTARRSRLREELLERGRILPTCPGCRAEAARKTEESRRREGLKTLQEFDTLLRRYGMKLEEWEWKGTSVKQPDGSMTFMTYLVGCHVCPKTRAVFLHQTRKKLEKRKVGSWGCPDCARKVPRS
jgi:hypothetical protein